MASSQRKSSISRTTGETDIRLELNVDGTGVSRIDTGTIATVICEFPRSWPGDLPRGEEWGYAELAQALANQWPQANVIIAGRDWEARHAVDATRDLNARVAICRMHYTPLRQGSTQTIPD